MSRPSRTTGLIAIVLGATVVGGLAWNAYWAQLPDIDDVGGTVLVYQLDRRAKQSLSVPGDRSS